MITTVKALSKGRIKRLHVDQAVIKRNRKHPDWPALPPVTIQLSAGSLKCHHARILGPSELIHRPRKPLSCGARIWIETKAQVEVLA